MNSTIRNIQLTAVVFVLFATVIAFVLEVMEMYANRSINLATSSFDVSFILRS